MTKPTLFLHIGTPKTGSTFLQKGVAHLDKVLAEHGLLYPAGSRRAGGHHDIAFQLGGGYPDWAISQDRSLEALGAELAASCADHKGDILLSSENLYLFPNPRGVKDFLDHLGLTQDREVKIIVYLRRQDNMLLSWYNQQVKALGFAGSFSDALEDMIWLGDYDCQLESWAEVFGPDALLVRNYDSAVQSAGGLWQDFMTALGQVLTLPETAGVGDVNVSLSRDILELQRVVNRLPLSIVEKRGFHRSLMDLTQQGSDMFSDTPLLPNAQRRALLAKFDACNARIAEQFFDSDTLFASPDLEAPDEALYDGMSLETVLAVLSWLILKK